MAAGLHISINAEKVAEIGGIPISNSILTTWVVLAFILVLSWKINQAFKNKKATDKPTRFQSFIEMIIESIYSLVKSIAGSDKKTRIFFPLVATFLLFILFSNWAGLIPGVGTVGITHVEEAKAEEHAAAVVDSQVVPSESPLTVQDSDHAEPVVEDSHDETGISQASKPESTLPSVAEEDAHSAESESEPHTVFVPLFRGPTADLNTTLALAVVAMFSVQVAGFKFLGFHYTTKFINFKGPIDFFVGFLEFVSELSKIISFAFRLFGNIFAGEVLLTVMAFLMPLAGPVPFLGLEIFVGFIQALVFSMLTLVFMNVATLGHAEEH